MSARWQTQADRSDKTKQNKAIWLYFATTEKVYIEYI